MKYYSYNPNSIVNNIAVYNKVLGATLSTADEIESTEPIALEPNTIKFLVAKLKEEKNTFKTLVSKFHDLEEHEVLTLMNKFYNFSSVELRKFQLEEYAKEFPVKKTIKTNMYIADVNDCFKIKYVKATVLAKKGVRFNPLKTYSKEELSKFIANDEIVIVSKEPFGGRKSVNKEENFLNIETLAKEFDEKTFDEDTIKIIEKKNPEALEELIYSIDQAELKNDFTNNYLPAYKKMLDYFVKCAKITVAQNEANKKNMQKQINKANEQNREMEDVKKFILDTSKGR